MSKPRVLVAVKDSSERIKLCRLLRFEDYSVMPSIPEAWVVGPPLRWNHFDHLIVDAGIDLPSLKEVVLLARRISENTRITAILPTADPNLLLITAHALLVAPYSSEELLLAMKGKPNEKRLIFGFGL